MRNHQRKTSWLLLAAFVTLALLAAPTPVAGADEKGAKINVNTATVEELSSLPGIGPAYAKRIIAYREQHGPFKRVEDLLNVQGIGDKTLERIREKVTVSTGK